MKRTAPLDIMVDSGFPISKVVIHPNEGYDLGLMQTCYPVKIYLNIDLSSFQSGGSDPMQGQIYLENACRKGFVEISKKCWEIMNKPERIVIVYDENKLLLLSAKKAVGE